MALVLVAALVPRAGADDGDLTASVVEAETVQVEPPELLVTPERAADADDGSASRVTPAQGGEATGTRSFAVGELRPHAPFGVAEHQTEDQQPGDTTPGNAAGVGDHDAGAQHQADRLRQDDQLLADVNECADGCSREPDLVAAATGGGAPGDPPESPPESPQPRRLDPLERDIRYDISVVEEAQAFWGAQGLSLDREEQYHAEVRLERAVEGIRQWRSQVAEGTPEAVRLEELTRRAQEAALQLLSEPSPWGRPTLADMVEWSVLAVERDQAMRDAQGQTRYPEEVRDDQFHLARAFEGIRQLRLQAAEGPQSERDWLAELTRRAQRAQQQLGEEVQRQAEGNPMSSVQLLPPLTPADEQAPDIHIATTHPGASPVAEQPRTGPPASDVRVQPIPPPPPFGGSKPEQGLPALEVTRGMPLRLEAAAAAVQTGKVAGDAAIAGAIAGGIGLGLYYALSLHPAVLAVRALMLSSPDVFKAFPGVVSGPTLD